jgi:transketolase
MSISSPSGERIKSQAAAEIALGQRLTPFTELIIEYAAKDPRICYVGVDTMDVEFQKRFPERAFDVGIAEQNQIGVATGLAKVGMIPVVQAWSPFTPLRNFDQLRTNMARHRANVKIVTTALGLVNCSHGTTHHDLESFALFRVIPNLIILAPMDGEQFEGAFRAAMTIDGPVVIMGPPEIYAPGRDGAEPLPIRKHPALEIGKSELLRPGRDACIFSFGPALRYSWMAAETLAGQGISTGVINMYSLKPLDHEIVRRMAEAVNVIVIVEEQSIVGGLGSAVAEIVAEEGIQVGFKRVGIRDQFVEQLGDWTQTREAANLTAPEITHVVKSLVGIQLGKSTEDKGQS